MTNPTTCTVDAPLTSRSFSHLHEWLAGDVVMLTPPYEALERHSPSQNGAPAILGPGAIVGLRISSNLSDWSRIEAAIGSLRAGMPSCPVILILRMDSPDCLTIASHAVGNHVREIISANIPIREQLLRSFTPELTLPEDVVEWLEVKGVRLSPIVRSLVLDITRLAPHHQSLTSLLAFLGMPETSARFRMQKKRLPCPSRWYQAARALHAALRIQREPDTCLLRLAHKLGYADHSALSQLVYRSFGVRPGLIRGTLGWEWLMDRWVALQRIRTSRDSLGGATPAWNSGTRSDRIIVGSSCARSSRESSQI